MQHLADVNRSHRARSPPGGRISAPGAIGFRAQNATFCVTAQRLLADLRPAHSGGSGV
jgi:hypothetical protein